MLRSDSDLSSHSSSQKIFATLGTLQKPSEDNLRAKILQAYPKVTTVQTFTPTAISMDHFIAGVLKWLRRANTPYAEKNLHGLLFVEDYVEHYFNNTLASAELAGLADPRFWEVSIPNRLFKSTPGTTANEALNSFFAGPTFAECGNVLQACIYRAIEEMIGTKEFNRIFSSPLSNFNITQVLFNKVYSQAERPSVTLEDRIRLGNPVFFLFDYLGSLPEDEIKVGDILHSEGIDKYTDKHLFGDARGWNLICVGKNSNNENLYLGFGPDLFTKPLTMRELQTFFIEYYNEDQTVDTKQIIENLKADQSIYQAESLEQAQLAESLKDDKIDANYPIGGIVCVIRLDPKKLVNFLQHTRNTWYSAHQSKNNLNAALNSFKATTPVQNEMLSMAKKFALSVCHHREAPVGLAITGMPGIGKTHLAQAIAHDVAQQGLKVFFLDGNTLIRFYKKLAAQWQRDLSVSELQFFFDQWLANTDLIVLDDVNTNDGLYAEFVKKAVNCALNNNKAIMLCGNQPLYWIKESLPDYIGYDDMRSNNFLFLQDMQGPSYRKTWWSTPALRSSISKDITNNQCVLDILAHLNQDALTDVRHPEPNVCYPEPNVCYPEPNICHPERSEGSASSASILLEEKNADLKQISHQYLQLSPNKNIKMRLLQTPSYANQFTDMYIHDLDQYDVFLMTVNNIFECEQCLFLISQMYDRGKKAILVTNDEKQFFHNIAEVLNYPGFSTHRAHLQDIINNVLLKKSDWMHLKPSIIKEQDYSQVLSPALTFR